MHNSAATHLRLDDDGTAAADLDDLTLHGERAGVQVDVATLESEHLADAQVSPEGEQDSRLESRGHRCSSSLHVRGVDQRSFWRVRLPGTADAAGIASYRVVGDGGVQDRAQERV